MDEAIRPRGGLTDTETQRHRGTEARRHGGTEKNLRDSLSPWSMNRLRARPVTFFETNFRERQHSASRIHWTLAPIDVTLERPTRAEVERNTLFLMPLPA